MTEVFTPEHESNVEGFIFPEANEQQEERLDEAEEKIEETCQSFAKALDSVSVGLTKELLDIFETLEGVLGAKEVVAGKVFGERTMLWGMAYRLLYEKHKDIFPEKLKDTLGKMLEYLSQYEEIKIKHKSLKEMLKSYASIISVQSTIQLDEGRTFVPGW